MRKDYISILIGSFYLLSIRVVGTAATFGYTYLLARILNPSEVGVVWSIWSASYIAGSVATLNIGAGAIREIVKARADSREEIASGYILVSRIVLFTASPIVTIVFILLCWMSNQNSFVENNIAYILAAMTIPILGWGQTNASQANALNVTIRSQGPRELIRPIIMLAAFAGFWFASYSPDVILIMGIYAGAVLLSTAIQFTLVRPHLNFVGKKGADTSGWKDWVKTGLMLIPSRLLAEYLKFIIIMLTSLSLSSSDVAMVAIALSIINFLNFAIVAVDLAFAPRISKSVHSKSIAEAKKLISFATAIKSISIVSASVIIYIFVDRILGIFGEFYVSGAPVALWFLLVPVSRALCGDSNTVMQIRGERVEILLSSTVIILALLIASVVAPKFGDVGFVTAVISVSLAAGAVLRCLLCRVRTGIDTSVVSAVWLLLVQRQFRLR